MESITCRQRDINSILDSTAFFFSHQSTLYCFFLPPAGLHNNKWFVWATEGWLLSRLQGEIATACGLIMKTVTRAMVEIAFERKIVDISTFVVWERNENLFAVFLIFDTVIKCVMKLAWKGVKNFLLKKLKLNFAATHKKLLSLARVVRAQLKRILYSEFKVNDIGHHLND